MTDDRIEGTAKKVAGTVQNTFGHITGDETQQIKGSSKKIEGTLQNAFGKANDFAHGSIDAINSNIKEKPIQSSVIALLAGVVLGRLFSSSRK